MGYQEPVQGPVKYRYGLAFPEDMSEFQIMLSCWKYHREEPYRSANIRDPHELFLKAIRCKVGGNAILEPDEFIVSRWTEQHVHAFTHENTCIVWGCASSGKSFEWGLLCLMDWYAGPHETITLLCSTSKEALRKRTFASVVHYHRLLKYKGWGFPGNEVPSKDMIVLTANEHEAASSKEGIFGVAVKDGPIAEAVGKIRGMHASGAGHVILGVDELSAMPPAVWDPKLRYNLRVGARRCLVFGLTNIDSWDDLAGRNSEPVEGRASVTIETESWRTRGGALVLRHDGFKSPAIVEPDGEKKYPHLLNKATLAGMIKEEGGNAEAPAIYTMIRAFPPSVSNVPTVVSPAEVRLWGMESMPDAVPPAWRFPPTVVAGLDLGFGGDDCALQRIDVGMDEQGRWVLWFDEERTVPINASDGTRPVMDQILAYCLPLFQAWGMDPRHFGIDDSGPSSGADAFARAWSLAITRFNFGERAGELPVSAFVATPAAERYSDRATELVFLYRMYGQYRQIRNMGHRISKQLTSRQTLQRGGRLALADKKTYKKTTGQRSPDQMDAGGIALGVVRYIVGLAPGALDISPSGPLEAAVNPGPGVDDATAAEYNNLESNYSEKLY